METRRVFVLVILSPYISVLYVWYKLCGRIFYVIIHFMKREQKIKIAKIILKTIAVAGVISMVTLAPNSLQALDMFYRDRKRRYNTKYYVKTSIAKLKEEGFIEFKEKNGKTFVELTEKGEQKLLKYQIGELVLEKPKKWDGKWRMIIFDIHEYRKKTRNELRNELINFGFLKLQNSVWVYPYDCEELMIMLKSYFHLGKDVLYLVVDRIENDKWLKREFGLV